jgi:hypothetical protein
MSGMVILNAGDVILRFCDRRRFVVQRYQRGRIVFGAHCSNTFITFGGNGITLMCAVNKMSQMA